MTHGILTFARFALIVCTVAMLVVTYCCVGLAARELRGGGDADDVAFHVLCSVGGVLTTILCVAMTIGLYGIGD